MTCGHKSRLMSSFIFNQTTTSEQFLKCSRHNVLWASGSLFQCATLAPNYPLFPCCQSSPGCKFGPTQLYPLRKCVPNTGQVRGQCGQAVIVPHITKVLWCQHNHIVCIVTTIWRAILLCQSFPIYGAFYVRKWMMAYYIFYAAKCVLLLQIQ